MVQMLELLVLLVLWVVLTVLASVVGAFILQMSSWTYNKLIGDPGPPHNVPVPAFWHAVSIMATVSMFSAPLTLMEHDSMTTQLAALAVSCVVMAVTYRSMLPTTYLRATLLMVLSSLFGLAFMLVLLFVSLGVLLLVDLALRI